MCVRVCICTYMHIMLLIGLTGVCCVVFASSSEAQGTHWCVYMVCVCEGGKMYVVVCH